AGGTFTVSNPALEPQRAETVEAGGSGAWGALGWEAAVYRIAVDDEVDFDPATFTYRNIGRSLHTGVETTARWTAAVVQPFLSYAFSRVIAREGEDSGGQLKNVPRHLLRAGIAASLPAGLRGEVVASRMFGRYADDANRFPLEDGVLLDLRLERDFGPLTARLDVLNAAGVHNDAIGFTLPDFSGGEAPYVYPGPRRAVRFGVAYRP
ncbi:MAG TPA: TonB-dependent receptor, partial [Thermoanaerobaculia bacterium]|nr:TonB-dependent receptor [Thermoanaerobaculia bacterium]